MKHPAAVAAVVAAAAGVVAARVQVAARVPAAVAGHVQALAPPPPLDRRQDPAQGRAGLLPARAFPDPALCRAGAPAWADPITDWPAAGVPARCRPRVVVPEADPWLAAAGVPAASADLVASADLAGLAVLAASAARAQDQAGPAASVDPAALAVLADQGNPAALAALRALPAVLAWLALPRAARSRRDHQPVPLTGKRW